MVRKTKQFTMLVVATIAFASVTWFAISNDPNATFQNAVQHSNEIVIHAKGYENTASRHRTVFLRMTDPDAISEFNSNIRFKRSFGGERCGCQGFPGIDWFHGTERIAYAGLQHETHVRWTPYSYDMPMTDTSRQWLARYMAQHGVPLTGMAEE